MLIQLLLLCSVALAVTLTHPNRTAGLFPAHRPGCPLREGIHPCICLETPSRNGGSDVKTFVHCLTIHNEEVMQEAINGMRGHVIDFLRLDSCWLPPFPNGLFFNVSIRKMNLIDSTVLFKQNFFECAANCW